MRNELKWQVIFQKHETFFIADGSIPYFEQSRS